MVKSTEHSASSPLELTLASQGEKFVKLSTAIAQLKIVRYAFLHDPKQPDADQNPWGAVTQVSDDLEVAVYNPSGKFNEQTSVVFTRDDKERDHTATGLYTVTMRSEGIDFRKTYGDEQGEVAHQYMYLQDVLNDFGPYAVQNPEELYKIDSVAEHAEAAYKYAQTHLLAGHAVVELP